MNNKDWIEEKFKSGLNCSQVVALYFAKKYGYDEKAFIKATCGFGGGMRKGEVCGAVSGGILAIGMKYGNEAGEDSESKKNCHMKTVEFEDEFIKKNGSIICRDLLKCDISTEEGMQAAATANLFHTICPKMILSAIEILEEKGY